MSSNAITISGFDAAAYAFTHVKGTPFFAEMEFFGVATLSDPVGIIYRVDDRQKQSLIDLNTINGRANVAETKIVLQMADNIITLPRGEYGIDVTAVVDGELTKVVDKGYFIIT
jgi:hypothetical protein